MPVLTKPNPRVSRGSGSEEGISREGKPAVAPAKRRTAAQRYESSSPPSAERRAQGEKPCRPERRAGKGPRPSRPCHPVASRQPPADHPRPQKKHHPVPKIRPVCGVICGEGGGGTPLFGRRKRSGRGAKIPWEQQAVEKRRKKFRV